MLLPSSGAIYIGCNSDDDGIDETREVNYKRRDKLNHIIPVDYLLDLETQSYQFTYIAVSWVHY